MQIGDKLFCDNGKMYTVDEGNGYYELSIIDELDNVVNLYHNDALEDCLPSKGDNAEFLVVSSEELTKILKVEKFKAIPKINSIYELLKHGEDLPEDIFNNALEEIADWIANGGNFTDKEIHEKYRHLEKLIK